MDIALIGDEDTVLGFNLVGVKNTAVFSKETIEADITKFAEAKILIITENVAAYLRENQLIGKITAAVAEIPDKTGSSGRAAREISRLFESAIGVKMKEK